MARGASEFNGALRIERVEMADPAFAEVRHIRRLVFIVEQGVSPANEFDAIDHEAAHFLCRVGDEPVATARVYGESGLGRIGRVAVVASHRGGGIGDILMRSALAESVRLGYGEVMIHAQIRVQAFYERLGFVPEGETFIEEDIPHVTMRWRRAE